jgi:hypothetical protein
MRFCSVLFLRRRREDREPHYKRQIAFYTNEIRQRCEKRISFEPFCTKNDHFCKTGSGQTYGKHSKKKFVFRRLNLPKEAFTSAVSGFGGGGSGGGGGQKGQEFVKELLHQYLTPKER